MDIVYFQGPKLGDIELRFSLRSMAANVPHEKVWFLGEPPDWVTDVIVVEAEWPPHKWWSLHAKHRMLAKALPDMADKVTAFDDDMYVLKPVDEIPPQHTGWLTQMNANVRSNTFSYAEATANSIFFLQGERIDQPLKISIHTPRVYEIENLKDLAERDRQEQPFMWRFVYGNLYTEPELLPVDVKAYNQKQFDLILSYDTGYLSSHNGSIHIMEEYLNELFPEKCIYEI